MPAPSTPQPTTPTAPTVIVHLPAELRARTREQAVVTVPSGDVRDIIAALDCAFPGLRFNLCAETGELRTFVNIFVNGRNVRLASALDTPVAPGSVVHIIHSVAGG
ncbi:MAG TPA: MoaD/ThiS family protein [Ktedonobacterales bacterium]|jgi:molybdopterin synthase sulfur carrier subunit|nr:MoaD/ThiS family protein [Ktedonobacterales bacterium]